MFRIRRFCEVSEMLMRNRLGQICSALDYEEDLLGGLVGL
jgi:hypothetical protein